MDENDEHDEERRHTPLSDEQLEKIAVRAAELVMDKIYIEIGKGLVKKLFVILGMIAIGLLFWLAGKGYLKP